MWPYLLWVFPPVFAVALGLWVPKVTHGFALYAIYAVSVMFAVLAGASF